MELVKSLIGLGLEEKEAKVYLALLSLNRATAYSVAVKSGIKKSTTYVILENLVKKEFVLKTPQKRRTVYLAKSPKEALAIAREKIYNFEESLPELMAIQRKDEEEATVSYYEGIDEIKMVYEKLLNDIKENKCVGFYGHRQNIPLILKEYWDEIEKKYKQLNIDRRIIVTDNLSMKDYIEYGKNIGINIKTLPVDIYDSRISIEVFDNKLLIFSHTNMKATLIDSLDVSSTMRQIFNLVWKLTKEEVKR